MTSTISYGDQVIVYSSREQLDSLIVTATKSLHSKFGVFNHDDMVGVAWGTKFPSASGRGFVYLLKPTPELWTLALPHRTQILYLPDIAFITSYLGLHSGSRVIEAGTGSGSFTHALARTVGAKGKVHSFEYHEERFEKALKEFEDHGLAEVVELRRRDVCKDGFADVEGVDAVFLDLPTPWTCLPAVLTSLRRDVPTRICCFSPCIEQVIRTCTALTSSGFSDITMFETLIRTHDPANALCPPIQDAIERIKNVEQKKERRREGQINDAKKKREAREKELAKKAAAEAGEDGTTTGTDGGEATEEEDAKGKKRKLEDDSVETPEVEDEEPKRKKGERAPPPPPPFRINTSKPSGLSRGHTSFLTFATLLPIQKPKAVEVDLAPNGAAVVETEAQAVEELMEGVESGAEAVVSESKMVEVVPTEGGVVVEETETVVVTEP
ncbi:hypothetical protein MNV49_006753 [Pseudohyphozyma bogoriensis]|nr:hypothetical protein MNV49_006753 [Pseudohyphozyma bogoriensis]